MSGVLLLPVLLPIAYTAKNKIDVNGTTSEGTFNELDKLSMGHIEVSTHHFHLLAFPKSICIYFPLR